MKVVLLFVVLTLTSAASAQTISSERFDSLCSTMQSSVKDSLTGKKIKGVTAAVVLADGRTCASTAGTRGTDDGAKLTTEDPIVAASIGKTFVSALALKLVEEGKLGLDDPVSKYLGTRPWFKRVPNANDITVRMLLNHSSGIPNHVELDSFLSASMRSPEKDVPFDYLVSFIFDKKPLFAAGKGYYYSDTNYILLGMVEEQVAGTKMYDEVTRRFVKPLKLEHTTRSDKNTDPVVYGMYKGRSIVKNHRLMINPQWEWAGGGFYSTPTDLAHWASALYGGNVLSKDSFTHLIGSTTIGEGKNYGLGVEIQNGKWGVIYGHDGEWPGYLSLMRYYSKYRVAVSMQINAGGTDGSTSYLETTADDLADLFITELVPDKLSATERAAFEKNALDWVHLVDAGKYAESWDDIVADLKARYARAAWPDALKPFRAQVGVLKSRTLKSVVRTEKDTISVDFASSFTKRAVASETVTLKLEADGKWRISGYSLHR